MISYEDLCSALAAYRARTLGEPLPPSTPVARTNPASFEAQLEGEEATQVGDIGLLPVQEDRSQELDLGDVLSDDEA